MLLLLLSLPLGGCFTTEKTNPGDLRMLGGTATIRISSRREETFRALVGPIDVGPSSIRYRRLVYGPQSWVVRFGGWPLVYTSGRVLRYVNDGLEREIPLEDVEELRVERYSWPFTLLSLPVTLPPGIIDFIVHHARFGFEDVDMGYDTFSRPPGGSRLKQTVPGPTPAMPEA